MVRKRKKVTNFENEGKKIVPCIPIPVAIELLDMISKRGETKKGKKSRLAMTKTAMKNYRLSTMVLNRICPIREIYYKNQ